MRGASDGSSPNYSNTSAVGFFFDDSSLSWGSVQPDLHLYDIDRIEVLSGPQGTTFGAGSMTGAIRYITHKPDVNSVSAGVDFNAGQIQNGQQNWTYEGFVNIPLIEGVLGFRASGFSDSHGGFIDNQLTERTWVNGAVSNNAAWARNDYNRSHNEGGRAALQYILQRQVERQSHLRLPAPVHTRRLGRGSDAAAAHGRSASGPSRMTSSPRS